MLSFDKWSIPNYHPELKLDEIEDISQRIYSLFSRNQHNIPDNIDATNVIGALDTIEALQYHFNQFSKLNELNNSFQKHEIVAYINRGGQFYYFLKSPFLKTYFTDAIDEVPNINAIYDFRRKITAHRSIDAPKGETEFNKLHQQTQLLGINNLRDKHGNLEFYIYLSENTDAVYFTPKIDHPNLMNQIYSFMEQLLNKLIASKETVDKY